MSATEFQMTTAHRVTSDEGQTETASIFVLDMAPCTKLKRALAEWRKQSEAQAAVTAKAKREDELRAAYVARHEPETPDAA